MVLCELSAFMAFSFFEPFSFFFAFFAAIYLLLARLRIGLTPPLISELSPQVHSP